MSNISSIHDAMYTLVSTLFPTKTQLADGLVIDNNADVDKTNGYGISFEEGTNTNRFAGCKMSIARNVIVTLTKEVFAIHQDKTAFKLAEKTMFEDHYLLIKEFENNSTINSLVVNRKYVNDSGIQRMFDTDGHKQFLLLSTTFEIEYSEDLL